MSENVGEIIYTVDADTRPFLEKMGDAESRLGTFEKAADKTTKATKDLADGSKDAAKAVDGMGSSMEQAAKKTETATDALGGTAKAAETTEEALARIAKTVRMATDETQNMEIAERSLANAMGLTVGELRQSASETKKVGDAASSAAKPVSDLERQSGRLASQMQTVKRVTEEEAAAITALMNRIDPTAGKIKQLDADIDQLNKVFNEGKISATQHAEALEKAEKKMADLDGSAKKASVGTQLLTAALTPLAAAFAAAKVLETAKHFIQLGQEMSVARVEINRLAGSAEMGAAVFESLLAISGRMGTSFQQTQQIWATLSTALSGLGKSGDEVLQLTETFQQLGALSGATSQQMKSALDTLEKGLISGKTSGEMFLNVMRTAPEVGRQIAAGLGVSVQDLTADIKAGKLTAEDLMNLLLDRSEKVNAEFSKLPRTVGEAGKAMETAIGAAVSKLNDAIGATTKLAYLMDKITNGINSTVGNLPDEVKLNKLMIDRNELLTQQARIKKSFFAGGAAETANAKALKDVEDQILAIQNRRVEAQKKAAKDKADFDAKQNDPNRTTAEADKENKKAEERIALLKKEGVERTKLKALQKLGPDATEADRKKAIALAIEEFNLEQAQAAKKKALRAEESQAKKDAAREARELAKEQKDAAKHAEENDKAITGMAAALSLASLKGKELAIAQAMLKLNKWATPEDIANVKRLAGAMYDLNEAKANKKLAGKVDPLVGEQQRFETELEELKKANDLKLIENDRYLELKGAAEYQHSLAMQKLQEEDFARQSFTNKFLMDGINALASATTQTLAGLISGTMNAKQAMAGFANVILNQAIGAIVELGFAQVKQAIMGKAAQAAAGAAYATQVSAQVQATSFLAAQAAFASTAAIPVVGPALAPAAATAAMGTAQGLGAPAIALSAASGRFNGGTVDGGSMYRVNEGGAPEIFNAANGTQYMLPGTRGEVVSSKNSGGGNMTNNIAIYIDSDGGSTKSGDGGEQSKMLADTLASVVVNEMTNQLRPGGLLWSMQNG